ncbi:MAG: thioredoxin-dependent thiol peroxidase [Chitinophagaceae bacterium]
MIHLKNIFRVPMYSLLKNNLPMMHLKQGDPAPDFHGVDQDGRPFSLSQYRGKKVVLYFYPKDDTPGCTAQACNLRDHYSELKNQGFEVIGISTDSDKSHKKFEGKYALPFLLVADPDKKIVEQYGVFGEKKFMGKTYMGTNRTTFLINELGFIHRIISRPDTNNHTEQVLEAWAS